MMKDRIYAWFFPLCLSIGLIWVDTVEHPKMVTSEILSMIMNLWLFVYLIVSTVANFLMLSLLGARGPCCVCGPCCVGCGLMRVGALRGASSALSRKEEKEVSGVSRSYKGQVSQGGQTGQLCHVAGRTGKKFPRAAFDLATGEGHWWSQDGCYEGKHVKKESLLEWV